MPQASLIPMFNKYAQQNNGILAKALTSATGVGEALIPESLERTITDTVIRLSPELALMQAKKISSKVHEFNRLVRRPSRGSAMGENATTRETQSANQRASVEMKVIRRKGIVTDFLQDTSEEYIDALAYEMENHLQAHVLDLISYLYYGNAGANQYEFSGWDFFINTGRDNQARGGVVPTSLDFLDDMIDSSNRRGGSRHDRVFLMSPEMLSVVSRLQTQVRLERSLMGYMEVDGGWRLNSYRNIPIIETTSAGAVEQMSSTITLSTVTTGGGLSNGTYYIQVSPITLEGEQEASAEQNITLSGGTATQRIRISLDAAHQTGGVNSALQYRVYVSTATGTEVLNTIVSAFRYNASGEIIDDLNGVGTNYIFVDSTTRDASVVPTHMQNDVPYVATGGVRPELVALIDLDPIQGLGKLPYVNTAGDQFNGLVTVKNLAETDDFANFLVKSYCALADSYEATSAWSRGWRVR